MGFSCECEDGPEFSSMKLCKARKVHICCECGEDIPVGTEYERYSGKWEGDVFTYATCERCRDLRDSYTELGYCVYLGELWENHRDMISDENSHAWNVATQVLNRRYELYLKRKKPKDVCS